MTWRLSSLLSRILWWHGIALLFTALVVSASVYLLLDSTADRFQRQTLRAHAESARGALRVDEQEQIRFAPPRPTPHILSVLVVDASGRQLGSMGPPSPVPARLIPRRAEPAYFTRSSRSAIFSGYSMPAQRKGQRLWIIAIQNLEHPDYIVDDVLRQFFTYALLIVGPLLLLLLAVDAWIVRRALRPVRDASALVRNLNAQQLDIRVPEARLPSEVRPLATAVNAALDRVVDSYRTQRDFTADAAHELRTPIALVRMRIEAVKDEALRAELKRDIDQLGRTVGQLLEIAELDGALPALDEAVDLRAMAVSAVSAIAPLVFARRQSIALTGTDAPVIVQGSAEMIARALNGLVENAVVHTPEGTSIEVRVEDSGMLGVSDDGPGIAESERELVFQRFWRSERSSSDGSGLGLAIVSRIAEAHGATLSLRTRPGQTLFALHFPTLPGRTDSVRG
ncbi:ATP-binding protein [Sphingomonas sp. HF-S4]|uniref:histidine kinase n=1 Tax=Sphingomonas agrestis TaxID=3080540 RepID=A0ABU3YA80_9SPHN|nr:ATP-binding protein [Sphingomonas sp. HF-S4]MDV3458290.1 ATP-binding protein [Sphingomonas sp. HF-S4]